MRRRIAILGMLAFSTLALASIARAGDIVYTGTGQVTWIQNPSGIWAGAQVGDSFTGVFTLDGNTPGSGDEFSMQYANPVVSVTLQVGSVTSSSPVIGSSAYVTNDMEQGEALRRQRPWADSFSVEAQAHADYWETNLNMWVLGDPPPEALGSTDLPTALDPVDFNSVDWAIRTDEVNYYVGGTISTIDVDTGPVATEADSWGAVKSLYR